MSTTPHVTGRPTAPGALLKVDAVAERLAVSPRTVKRYIAAGKLPATKLPGGGVRVEASDLADLARSRAS